MKFFYVPAEKLSDELIDQFKGATVELPQASLVGPFGSLEEANVANRSRDPHPEYAFEALVVHEASIRRRLKSPENCLVVVDHRVMSW